jgi:hypothetical protein
MTEQHAALVTGSVPGGYQPRRAPGPCRVDQNPNRAAAVFGGC